MQSQPWTPDASTRIFAVLGKPVKHSLSPAMHNAALRAMGINALYVAFEVDPARLPDVLPSFSHLGLAGCNLTVPHKEVAFKALEHLAPSAVRAGSVNTLKFLGDGVIEGHSTDGYGLRMALTDVGGQGFSGASVLILGCGGAGRAAAIQAAEEGAAEIRLTNRTASKVDALIETMQTMFPNVAVRQVSWPPKPDDCSGTDVVIQSTTLGMKPEDEVVMPAENWSEGQVLVDMTYSQRETPMMCAAKAGGAHAVNGLGMLLHQGVKSLEIWTGESVPVEVMREALEQAMYGGKDDA